MVTARCLKCGGTFAAYRHVCQDDECRRSHYDFCPVCKALMLNSFENQFGGRDDRKDIAQ